MQGNSMGSSSGGSGLADLYRIQIEIGDLENNIALLKNQQNTLVAQIQQLPEQTGKFTGFLTRYIDCRYAGNSFIGSFRQYARE